MTTYRVPGALGAKWEQGTWGKKRWEIRHFSYSMLSTKTARVVPIEGFLALTSTRSNERDRCAP